jgi:hypothetical protein
VHEYEHCEPLHTWSCPQGFPQLPQFFVSFDVFTHVVPHIVLGGAHDGVSGPVSTGPTPSSVASGDPGAVPPPLAHPPLERETPTASAKRLARSEAGRALIIGPVAAEDNPTPP